MIVADGWQLSALEFSVALHALGRDRMPYPFTFRAPGSSAEEVLALRLDAGKQLAVQADGLFRTTLTLLLEPQIRVEVHGFTGPELRTPIRIHAGISGRTAVLAVQRPNSQTASGEVTIRRCSVDTIAQRVVAELPTAAAGDRRAFTAERSARAAAEESYVRPADEVPRSEQIDRFFRRPRTCVGEIGVFDGVAVDARATSGRTVHWFDFVGDGRYVVKGDKTKRVVPVSAETFAAEIDTLVHPRVASDAVLGRRAEVK
ncbi:ESX secretion-associated protein EspG [Antrihabitans spumae]|uniref:ESX secretion-associated protein EspG n=1 Tax=Antrihabitans spumae TaxID=3373370 RepID=A0ABW7KFF3_9NOCA